MGTWFLSEWDIERSGKSPDLWRGRVVSSKEIMIGRISTTHPP